MLTPDMLKQYSYFSTLSMDAVCELAKKMDIVSLPAGAEIIRQGTPPDYFYFVKEGEVEITKTTRFAQEAKISVLGSGEGFGEVAMLTCSHRACTVMAKTDVALYRLSKRDFEDVIMMDSAFTSMLAHRVKDYARFNKMKTLQPFALLEPEKMSALMSKMAERKFAAGENIIAQGEKGDYYYVIKSGRAAVLVKPKGGGNPERVAVLGEGEGFGEEALIRDHKRNATVQAVEETSVLGLSKTDFDGVLKSAYLEFAFPEEIPLEDYKERFVIIDARVHPEYEEEHIEGSINIPLEELRQKYTELDPSKDYLTYCTNDSRGMAAAFLLFSHGFKAKNLRGGLSGWEGPVSGSSDGIHLPAGVQ